jgi:UDP-glucose 4-epimerase
VSARRALVTGGAGFIGSHIVDALLEQGWSVCVLDDFSTGHQENLATSLDRIELLRGDVRDAEAVAQAIDGAEVVFHQAALPSVPVSVREPLRTHAINLGGTLEVLEGARRAGVRRLVYATSSSVYGDAPDLPKRESMRPGPCSPYALQKYAGEVYCRMYTELYGLETVALRYFNVYGPRQDPQSDYAAVIPVFVNACLAGRRPHIHGNGAQTRDFVFVSDVARANLLAAESPKGVGDAVNVAGGRSISIVGLWQAIRAAAGSDLEPIHEPARPGDVRDSLADLTRANELLGFQPTIDLEEGLRRTLQAAALPQPGGHSS